MVIIWGTNLYGKVDEVPGVCWVATQFFHLWYIPLVPMGSQAIFEQDGDSWSGAPVGLSGKSVLVAYLRAALILLAIGGIIGLFVTWSSPRASSLLPILCAIGGIVGFVGSKMLSAINLASYPRARGLCRQLRLPEEVHILVDVAYGQLHPQEAEERLEALSERYEAEAAAAEEQKAERREERERRKAEREHERREKREADADLRAKAPRPRKRSRSKDEDGAAKPRSRTKTPKTRRRKSATEAAPAVASRDDPGLKVRAPKARKRRRV